MSIPDKNMMCDIRYEQCGWYITVRDRKSNGCKSLTHSDICECCPLEDMRKRIVNMGVITFPTYQLGVE